MRRSWLNEIVTVHGTPIRKTARSVRRCKTRTKSARIFVLLINGRPLRPADLSNLHASMRFIQI